MKQNMLAGNAYQDCMRELFDRDLVYAVVPIPQIWGREYLVYSYISRLGQCFEDMEYRTLALSPYVIYTSLAAFKKNFVTFWSNVLDIEYSKELLIERVLDKRIVDKQLVRHIPQASLVFDNGGALTAQDCLNAIYDLMDRA